MSLSSPQNWGFWVAILPELMSARTWNENVKVAAWIHFVHSYFQAIMPVAKGKCSDGKASGNRGIGLMAVGVVSVASKIETVQKDIELYVT
jgi:hypothetical protein